MIKDQKHIIEAPMQDRLINEVTLDKGDKKLLSMLKNHLIDML